MHRSRKDACTLIVAAAIAAFIGTASPCYGAGSGGQGGGSTFVTLGATVDIGLRAGLEYRSPAGFGVEVAVGSGLMSLEGDLMLTSEVLVVLPLFALGSSGAFALMLGVPDIIWMPSVQALMISVGAAPRLRFDLSSQWSLLFRAGVGYPLFFAPEGVQSPSEVFFGMWPDLGIGAAFRL